MLLPATLHLLAFIQLYHPWYCATPTPTITRVIPSLNDLGLDLRPQRANGATDSVCAAACIVLPHSVRLWISTLSVFRCLR